MNRVESVKAGEECVVTWHDKSSKTFRRHQARHSMRARAFPAVRDHAYGRSVNQLVRSTPIEHDCSRARVLSSDRARVLSIEHKCSRAIEHKCSRAIEHKCSRAIEHERSRSTIGYSSEHLSSPLRALASFLSSARAVLVARCYSRVECTSSDFLIEQICLLDRVFVFTREENSSECDVACVNQLQHD